MMTATVNSGSFAPVDVGQASETAKSPGHSGHRNPQDPPAKTSDSKIVRLKLTKPRRPRSNPQEVDWDEDLRPTPNEIVEANASRGRTSVAHTGPKKSKKIDIRTVNKRTKPSKPSTAPAKRRKSNPTKSNTAKQEKAKPSQLPLITLAASALAATIDKDEPPLPNQLNHPVVKNIKDLAGASHQTSPPKDNNKKKAETSPRVSVEIRSSRSVTSDSSSGFDYGIKFPSQSQKISILEHKAQLNKQNSNSQVVTARADTSSSSDGSAKKPIQENASKITIHESKAQRKSTKTKVVRETSVSKKNGRAQNVGNKLMLALHGNEESQHEPIVEDDAPIIISSDLVEPEKSPQKRQPESPPIQAALKPAEIERVPEGRVSVGSRQHQVKSETIKPPSPVITNKTKEAEEIDATGGMATWGSFLESLGHSSRSSTEDCSDIELGRGLMDDGPSILDYHMGTEHLSGFEALQPIRSGPTTSSQLTKPCESPAPTSSDTSIAGKTIDPTAVCIEKHKSSHTPESQKPLLPNDTLTEFNYASPQHSKSISKASIVDRNGSPRLVPQSNRSTVALQLDLDGEPIYEEEARIADISPSEYDRSQSEPSTEGKYDSVIWTKFQRDMFKAYGIETDRLPKSHPWPPQTKHQQPSFSQEETVDGANPHKGSATGPTSSQQTIEERGLGVQTSGKLDRSFCSEISGSAQPDMQSHRSSDEDPMDWTSTLQAAQKDAYNLLHQTNAVSSAYLLNRLCVDYVLESLHPAGCRESHRHTRTRDLPSRLRSDAR
jgi:hypothetical protein